MVIIESFADLRSAKAIGSAPKPKDKPLIVGLVIRTQLAMHIYIYSLAHLDY